MDDEHRKAIEQKVDAALARRELSPEDEALAASLEDGDRWISLPPEPPAPLTSEDLDDLVERIRQVVREELDRET